MQLCPSFQRRSMQSHIRKVHVCLAVTCHLHFWQNHRDLLHAAAVTGTDTEMSHHRKLILVKKILPPPLPGIKPVTFWSQVCQWSTTEFSLKISISDPILCPQTQFEHMKLEVTVYWRYLHVTGNMHTPRQLSWFLWRGILFEIPIHFWRLEIKSIPQH